MQDPNWIPSFLWFLKSLRRRQAKDPLWSPHIFGWASSLALTPFLVLLVPSLRVSPSSMSMSWRWNIFPVMFDEKRIREGPKDVLSYSLVKAT